MKILCESHCKYTRLVARKYHNKEVLSINNVLPSGFRQMIRLDAATEGSRLKAGIKITPERFNTGIQAFCLW